MRVPLVLARRLPPHPRLLHPRPRFPNISRFCRYSTNTGSTENGQQQKPAQQEPLPNASSNSGAVGKYLLASAVAGGLGYAYATFNRSSQPQPQLESQSQSQSQLQDLEEPKYGSPQDFKTVGEGIIVFSCGRRIHADKFCARLSLNYESS